MLQTYQAPWTSRSGETSPGRGERHGDGLLFAPANHAVVQRPQTLATAFIK